MIASLHFYIKKLKVLSMPQWDFGVYMSPSCVSYVLPCSVYLQANTFGCISSGVAYLTAYKTIFL